MEWRKLHIEEGAFGKICQRLDAKKTRLDASRPLSEAFLRRTKESLNLEWTYNSNSIEGNTLNLQETRLVLQEGFTVKGKSLREHFEVVNHQEAIEFVESLIKPNYVLNADDILSVHSVVLNKIEKDFAGRIRNGGVRIMGANFTPPNAAKVYDLLNELIEWVQYEGKMLHPVVMASIFHHRFVWIHPFFDGNGRTVRLLFNLLLMKEGYPPAIILKNDRKKYYDALNRANKGDYNKIILLVMQAMERSLDIYLSNLDDEANDYQAISTIVNDSNVPYGQEYVSLLARRGEIDAFKEGNVWFTSKKALVEYISSRKRKRHLE